MPTRCAAIGCTNTHAVPGVSLHLFPRCPKQRKLWVLAVRRDKYWEPSKHSVVCSAHFRSEDFVRDPNVTANLQCAPLKRFLKPGAVPSLISHRKKESKPRAAFEKRRRLELVNSALAEAAAADSSSAIERSSGGADKQSRSDVEASGITGYNKNSRCQTCSPAPPTTASKFSQTYLQAANTKGTMTTLLLRNWGVQTAKTSF